MQACNPHVLLRLDFATSGTDKHVHVWKNTYGLLEKQRVLKEQLTRESRTVVEVKRRWCCADREFTN